MARDIKMCVVNTAIVEEIRSITGTQAEIMTQIGISWNSWIKVEGGFPIRLSVGERLRERVLERLEEMPGLEEKFPAKLPGEKIDRLAIAQNFLKPVIVRGSSNPGLRSVRLARLLVSAGERSFSGVQARNMPLGSYDFGQPDA